MIRTIIVDDEPVAQRGLKKYVQQIPELALVATCENALEAEDILSKSKVDIMLLDIQMPYVNGIEFLKKIGTQKPLTIIISAYPNFALEGFELEVIDYLIKPVDFPRFKQAIDKTLSQIAYKKAYEAQHTSNHYLLVKTNKAIEKIAFDNIVCIEALHNYIAIHTIQKKIIVYQSLKNIEQSLPQRTFLKVHKSFIIAIHKVQRIVDNAKLDIGLNMLVPISRNIKTEAIATIKKHLTTHL